MFCITDHPMYLILNLLALLPSRYMNENLLYASAGVWLGAYETMAGVEVRV